APRVIDRKGAHLDVLDALRTGGFVRARIDGRVRELEELPKLDPKRKHTIEAVVDRFKVRPDGAQRLAESFETALKLGDGVAKVAPYAGGGEELTFSDRMACSVCGFSLAELEPRLFSFNNPAGACPACDGLGTERYFPPEHADAERRYNKTTSNAVREAMSRYMRTRPCAVCQGARLNRAARNVFVADRSLPDIAAMSVETSLAFFRTLAPE